MASNVSMPSTLDVYFSPYVIAYIDNVITSMEFLLFLRITFSKILETRKYPIVQTHTTALD